jgi:CheY-like chemotaxis protein
MTKNQQVDVVVADDNEESVDLMATLIKSQNYKVVARYSGAECIVAVARLRPQLIITDIVMPTVSGIDVLHATRIMDTAYQPFVASMTGWNDSAHLIPDGIRGFDLQFSKPVSFESIKMMLDLVDAFSSQPPDT